MSKVLDPVLIESHALGENIGRLVGPDGKPFGSARALARHLHLTEGEGKTVSRLVSDPGHGFSYATLKAIADGFGVEPWLMLIPGFNPLEPTHRQFWNATLELWQRKPNAHSH